MAPQRRAVYDIFFCSKHGPSCKKKQISEVLPQPPVPHQKSKPHNCTDATFLANRCSTCARLDGTGQATSETKAKKTSRYPSVALCKCASLQVLTTRASPSRPFQHGKQTPSVSCGWALDDWALRQLALDAGVAPDVLRLDSSSTSKTSLPSSWPFRGRCRPRRGGQSGSPPRAVVCTERRENMVASGE